MQHLPKRNELKEEDTWDLTDLYLNEAAWEEAFSDLKTKPAQLSGYAGRLGESAAVLLAAFRLEDAISVDFSKLLGYASCKHDEDTADNRYQAMRGKAMALYTEIASAASFMTPEIMALSDETVNRFFETEPGLADYRRKVEGIRRRKEHILSAEGELLLASLAEVAGGPDRISGIFRDAELKFGEVTDREGNPCPLTNETLVVYLTASPDRDFRKRVFEQYYRRLGEYQNTLAATLDAQFKQLCFFADARHYDSTLAASLDETEVPTAVYHNLIQTVKDNMEPMYRYVALRKKVLGGELHMYDVYTPIVSRPSLTVRYEEAKDTVRKALSVLGEDYTALLDRGFTERWIDVYENEGKRSGAYSSGFGHPHPYVLLNYTDDLESMFTLAHEMGHTLHTYYSTQNQPVANEDYVIFVAEVASTCNEVLLTKYLLSATEDKAERAFIINHFLDQFKGTVYRQTMFAEFELAMGRRAESGETLTADWLNETYLALNKRYFGPEMISDDFIKLEWARIPHFFYDYYVFQYATGFAAAVALANRILTEGEPAVKAYKEFLSGGSSADPISLLKIAGVDMSTPAPIQSALKLFGELVNELEVLL